MNNIENLISKIKTLKELIIDLNKISKFNNNFKINDLIDNVNIIKEKEKTYHKQINILLDSMDKKETENVDNKLRDLHSDLIFDKILNENNAIFKERSIKKINNVRNRYKKITFLIGILSIFNIIIAFYLNSDTVYDIFLINFMIFLLLIYNMPNKLKMLIVSINEKLLSNKKSLYEIYDESNIMLIEYIKKNEKYKKEDKERLIKYFVKIINEDSYHVYLENIIFIAIEKIENFSIQNLKYKKITKVE